MEEKARIQRMFALAGLIANRVGFAFNDPKSRKETDLLQPWDLYPTLFAADKEEVERIREQRELEEYKQRRMAQAAMHNAMRKDEKHDGA